MRKLVIFLFSFLMSLIALGQTEKVWLDFNAGQWDQSILHRVKLSSGDFFITQKGMAFNIHNAANHSHDGHHGEEDMHGYEGQFITNNFVNSNWGGILDKSGASDFYSNYYIGNDSSKWKSFVRSYGKSVLKRFYPGIDLVYEGDINELKYTFYVEPGFSPQVIQSEIKGADRIEIRDNGDFIIHHRFGSITEKRPTAWQIIDGQKVNVAVNFILNNEILSYDLGSYDKNHTLVIDPSLTFSTFSGSTADNWGSTATPDSQGNVFGAGVVFSPGFPTTAGAYDQTFNGTSINNQNFDVGIMKFSANGANLLYSTYLGGALSNEFPSSMVCAPNGELYVLGMTGSSDFPMAGGGFDVSFGGGVTYTPQGGSAPIPGSDLFIARFNPNGTALLSSTYMGGNGNDGFNGDLALRYNYGDSFRGEITLDSISNVYVASSTVSMNFPTVGAGGQVMGGPQCGVAFKLNPQLNTLFWSRYIGGTGSDAAYSIQVANNGNVYVAGGTNSTDMVLSTGNSLTNGGDVDGFILRLNGLNGATVNGTYLGLNEYDQVYFVQTDIQNNPYVLGQTESNYAISTGKYGNANSGQFIRKYSANLQTIIWTTVIGASTGNVDFSPTAFLVSDCFDIYLAGWGGILNANQSQAVFSSTLGLPVTPDAFQPTTLGDNFYLAVLGADATSLKYATFFGGLTSTQKHVDGGTSRFDKGGRVYHAVCAACGGQPGGFTSTPGAWATTNNSTNCNMAVFKFDLNVIEPLISVLDPLICFPEPVVFQNNTTNANLFFWTFGDGTSSTVQSPSHIYPGAGTYTVTLIASDALGCYLADTSTFIIDVGDFSGGIVQPTDTICRGQNFGLQASGGAAYLWSPAQFLDDPTSATPTATVNVTTQFTVVISDSCGVDTLSLILNVHPETGSASNDTTICIGQSTQISASGGGTYLWTPSVSLSDSSIANPIATPTQTTTYNVLVTSINGCIFNESVVVSVESDPPVPIIDDTLRICSFSSGTINVSGSDSYSWNPNSFINTTIGAAVVVNPPNDMYYFCDFTNSCGTIPDSIFVDVLFPQIQSFGDTVICPGDFAILSATGAESYLWFPAVQNLDFSGSIVRANPQINTVYQVVGIDSIGCADTSFVIVNLFPQPILSLASSVLGYFGEPVELNASSNVPGNFTWTPPDFLSCINCASTIANPNTDFEYSVYFQDLNGCEAQAGIKLTYDPIIYVPNTFTPDNDQFNPTFSVVALNIKSFQLDVYNRWGELIATLTESLNEWDGTYGNIKCQDGVYTWKMVYRDFYETAHMRYGHVNILR